MGVWTLEGDRPIIAAGDGPATILVPGEAVRLMCVDLPVAGIARRREALPFAIEDQVAEPVESLHLVLGPEIAPRRHLVAVVSHAVMAQWAAIADAGGLGHAAIVPDPLSLPVPSPGEWFAAAAGPRVLVRSSDGTGFACSAGVLGAAWEAAGRPAVTALDATLPAPLDGAPVVPAAPLGARVADAAIDLRTGRYARRTPVAAGFGRRLGWVIGLGLAAHLVIALADTAMLDVIAGRRASEARAAAALAAPGVSLGDDLVASVTPLLPQGSAPAPDRFLPQLVRISAALAPLGPDAAVRSIRFDGAAIAIELAGAGPGLAARIDTALRSAGIAARVAQDANGTIRVATSNG